MYNLTRIKSIRRFLTREACETLVIGMCISHLDYSNGVLTGLPKSTTQKLQQIQSMASKIILRSQYSSTTEALQTLHWLPIVERISFKIITLVHKCIHGSAPQYLKDSITILPVKRNLRSNSDTTRLLVPHAKCKTFPQDRSVSMDHSNGICYQRLYNITRFVQ